MTLAVVVCAYALDRWLQLQAAIASLIHQSLPPAEIVVVVDHNPRLRELARAALPNVLVIENQDTPGLSGARNAGWRATRSEIVAFLDDDAVADHDWLQQLALGYVQSAVVGVGGVIEPAWSGQRPGWFPDEFDWVVGCTYRGMPTTTASVRNLIGTNMSLRREALERVAGFQLGRVGKLSVGHEDDETDLFIRVSQAYPASRILFVPTARVSHQVRAERSTLRYFLVRCYSEGISKARLAKRVGTRQGLATERAYTLRTLPRGVVAGLVDTFRHLNSNGLRRASAIVLGLTSTLGGYLAGQLGPHSHTPSLGVQPSLER